MKPAYRLLDHTADLGVEWEAAFLPELFDQAAAVFGHLVAGDRGPSGEAFEIAVEAEGVDLADLLVRFLAELQFRFETSREVPAGAEVLELETHRDGARLKARAAGRLLDPDRDEVSHVIKAVTHHVAVVEETPGGWFARVVFDT